MNDAKTYQSYFQCHYDIYFNIIQNIIYKQIGMDLVVLDAIKDGHLIQETENVIIYLVKMKKI
jgi:hypothetical protein